MKRLFSVHDIFRFSIDDEHWPAPVEKNIIAFWKAYEISANDIPLRPDAIDIELIPSKRISIPDEAINIDNQLYVTHDAIVQKCRYKFARFQIRISGLQELKKIRLTIAGNYASHWVWPFHIFSGLLRWLSILKETILLHGLGLSLNNGAVLLTGSSGTGKTLSALAWLNAGGKYFGDDKVFVRKGELLGHWNPINLWYHRYQDNPDLAKFLPKPNPQETKDAKFSKLISTLTLGKINLSTNVHPADHYPEAFASPAPLKKIIVMRRGEKLGLTDNPHPEQIARQIKADLLLEAVNVMRWQESLAHLGTSNPLANWYDASCAIIDQLVSQVDLQLATVPEKYSPKILDMIQGSME
ncbi:MAG: hypothetical protein KAR11_03330 [Phycisphaerae bacterium]|nr:hypothetical protein [Phycisphaerae bacterium]